MKLRTLSVRRLTLMTATLCLASATVCGLSGTGDVASLLGGGAFMLVNFHLIRMLVSRVMTPGASPALSLVLVVVKFVLGLALVAGVFYQLPVEPLSFAFGTSLLLVGAVLEASLTGESVKPLDDSAP